MNEAKRSGRPLLASCVAIAAVFAAVARAQTPDAPAAPGASDTPEVYDSPVVLHAVDTAPAKILLGPGFRVEDAVPTDGLTTRFTIRSDYGVFEAYGMETLALRVAEVAAIRQLDDAFRSDAFGRAASNTAARPGEPDASGLGRFLGEAAAAPPPPAAAADREKERRDAARRLGVDPYTPNSLLATRLEEVARVAVNGRVGANALLPAATPASIAMPGTEVAHHWIYDTPAPELIAKNEQRLRAFGASEEAIRKFQSARGFTLTTQTALIEALGRLAEVQGRGDVISLAADADMADQALYLVRAVSILADRNEQAPIDVLFASGTLVARQKSGQIVVPLPVDYVAWTEPMARFAKRPELAADERGVWISGRTTSRARERFEALGWAVHEGVKP